MAAKQNERLLAVRRKIKADLLTVEFARLGSQPGDILLMKRNPAVDAIAMSVALKSTNFKFALIVEDLADIKAMPEEEFMQFLAKWLVDKNMKLVEK